MTPVEPLPPLPLLPADLAAFLAAGQSLPDPNDGRERQSVAFRPLADLSVEQLEVDPGGWDYFTESDHEPELGIHLVPGVRLATLGEADYGPVRVLVWLPEEQRYGVWDSDDHCLQALRCANNVDADRVAAAAVFEPRAGWRTARPAVLPARESVARD